MWWQHKTLDMGPRYAIIITVREEIRKKEKQNGKLRDTKKWN